jgi:trimeric autotransporter adhesin
MNKLQSFTSSGTFNVPAGVSCGFITQTGGGGGAAGQGAGAGASQICSRMPIKLIPGGTFSVTVGAKGLGAVGYTNTPGGDSVAGGITVNGGHQPFPLSLNPRSGQGGGCNGAGDVGFNADGLLAPRFPVTSTLPISGGQSQVRWWGGGSGGGSGGAAKPDGNSGAPCVNNNPGAPSGGPWVGGNYSSAGGASSFFGQGGQGATNNSPIGHNAIATHYGAGGGGGIFVTGGDGAGGVVWIEYIMP